MNPMYNEWIREAIERYDFVYVKDNVFLRLNSVGGLTLVAELKARWVHNDLIKEAEMLNDEDDDIQEYKRPWVGLTDDEINEAAIKCVKSGQSVNAAIRAIEAKLKEKNGGV